MCHALHAKLILFVPGTSLFRFSPVLILILSQSIKCSPQFRCITPPIPFYRQIIRLCPCMVFSAPLWFLLPYPNQMYLFCLFLLYNSWCVAFHVSCFSQDKPGILGMYPGTVIEVRRKFSNNLLSLYLSRSFYPFYSRVPSHGLLVYLEGPIELLRSQATMEWATPQIAESEKIVLRPCRIQRRSDSHLPFTSVKFYWHVARGMYLGLTFLPGL
jgi:hypothetical protein